MIVDKFHDFLPGEDVDLKLHVDVCQRRYNNLVDKIDDVERRLDKIEGVLEEIKAVLSTSKHEQLLTYLKWSGTVIGVLLTGLIAAVVKLAG